MQTRASEVLSIEALDKLIDSFTQLNEVKNISEFSGIETIITSLKKIEELQLTLNQFDKRKLEEITLFRLSIDELEKLLEDKNLVIDVKEIAVKKLNDERNKLAKLNSESIKEKEERDVLSNQLRTNLHKWIDIADSKKIKNKNIKVNGVSLGDALYSASLTHAKINPLNTTDFATLEEISPDKQVVTSDQYQYDIDSLKSWLEQKTTNPFTNNQISKRDLERIKLLLIKKYPQENVSFHARATYADGDPNFADSMLLAQQLSHGQQGIQQPQFPYAIDGYLLPDIYQPQRNLPVHSLPDWMSVMAAAKLPNGHIAIAREDNHGEIQIINPDNNEIVQRIQNGTEVSGIVLLGNGNIAVGHYYEENINIYDPATGNRVNRIIHGDTGRLVSILQRSMIASGMANIIISGSNFNSDMTVLDTITGQVVHAFPRLGQVDSIVAIANNIAINYAGRPGTSDFTIIYDSEFNIVNRFNRSGANATQVAALNNGNFAFASGSNVLIYDSISGVLVKHFDVPNINVIRSLLVLENGNILMAGAFGLIAVYTPDGTLVHEAKTNQRNIDSPVTLKIAYEKLIAMNALQVAPPQNVVVSDPVPTLTTSTNPTYQMPVMTPSTPESSVTTTTTHGLFSTAFRPNSAMRYLLSTHLVPVDFLRRWEPATPGDEFTHTHSDAILYFINDMGYTPSAAIDMINRKSVEQVSEMMRVVTNNGIRMIDVD